MTSPPSCSTLPSAQRWSAFNIFEQHWDDCMCIRLHYSRALIIAAHHHARTNKHISVWALLRFAPQQEGRMFRNISRKIVWNSHCFWALWQFCQTSTIFPLSLFKRSCCPWRRKTMNEITQITIKEGCKRKINISFLFQFSADTKERGMRYRMLARMKFQQG